MAIEDFKFIKSYTISASGLISTEGDVYLDKQCTSLSERFESVGGGFYCWDNKLTTLKGAPKSVGGYFWCQNNKLTSLEGAPQSMGGNFSCYNNKLTSLEGAPQSVGGCFYCDWIKDLPMLDLLQYKYVKIYENKLVDEIFRKYCGNLNKQNIMACIQDLHAAGLATNARFY